MKIKTVIIDDENTARTVLRKKLEDNLSNDIVIVGEADSVSNAEIIIRETKPDLVFLDIKMRSESGFDLLKNLGEIDFEVVFITAYDNFAIQAFEFSAFGYLLKPVKTADLIATVERLKKENEKQKGSSNIRVRVLMENYGDGGGKIRRLVINNVLGFMVLDISEIVRLKSESNYTHFFMTNGKRITVSRTMGEYETLLNEHGFFRIHQSHIVNLRHVAAYLKSDRGQVKMNDGELLQVSRERRDAFIARFL
jgi:two-component system, LytTR family, response regulator